MNDIYSIKQKICTACSYFDKEKNISVLNFLQKLHINPDLIQQNSDGIRIDLDKLSDEIIIKLDKYIDYKMKDN
jgi:uncharacterized protein YihD (DUF1040 family)